MVIHPGFLMTPEKGQTQNTRPPWVGHECSGADDIGFRINEQIDGGSEVHIYTHGGKFPTEDEAGHPGIIGQLIGAQCHVSGSFG